ncbi:hypothetical protein Taro_050103 [Colocasia esculenta]|uniref:Uncharacterized protein n=1 Tax=Colocasia esculenta TaxID=4460 RepID=A0A843XCW7_COLES|nr:hypothetical protein [Colocasia esculenta]
MAADYWLAASPLDADPYIRPHPWTPACGWRPDPWTSTGFTRNDPQKTTKLFSFGRPEEEKLKSRHHPQLNSVNQRVNVVNRQPLHRQRESGGIRKHPRDPVTERKRTVYTADQFQEGVVESTSDEDNVDNVESDVGTNDKGKGVATEIPLLTRKAHRRSRKKKVHVHLKLVIGRLNAQGQILCTL